MSALAWLGRLGSVGLALAMVLGMASEPVGDLLRPYLGVVVVALLVLAFMRTEPSMLGSHFKKPKLIILVLIWNSVLMPMLTIVLVQALSIETTSSGLYLALVLQAVASPLMSAPAYAALLGLNATLVLASLIASTLITPITASLFVAALELEIALSPVEFGIRLCGMLGLSAGVGFGLRRLMGAARVERRQQEINGINLIILYLFCAAAMGSVPAAFMEDPGHVLMLTGISFVVFIALGGLTILAFRWAGADTAMALAILGSLRNLALMLSAVGTVGLPETTWLYFAVSQAPIYLGPLLVERVIMRKSA